MKWKNKPALVNHMNDLQKRHKRAARFNSISLNEEVLSTNFVEDEAIVESRSSFVKTINDVNSKVALLPSHLPILKSKMVMSLPNTFHRLNLYFQRHKKRAPLISRE